MKVRFSVFTIVLLLLALTACVAMPVPTEAPLPEVRYINFKIYDPTYVAMDMGFDVKHGVKIVLSGDVLAGPNAIQAIAAGSADAGASSIAALVNANAAGLPVQGVVDLQTTFSDQPLQKWYVRSDSPIQALTEADLCGANYAVNIWRSSFHYTSLMMMDKYGIPEDCVNWSLLSFGNQIPALAEGSVDIIGLMQPYQGYADAEYGDQFRELYNDHDEVYGERMVSLIFQNRLWAEYNPEVSRNFVAALVEAIDWIKDNQAAAKPIIAKYTGIEEKFIADYHYTEHGQVVPADIQFWIDYMLARGDITADWLKPEDVGTNAFNPYQ